MVKNEQVEAFRLISYISNKRIIGFVKIKFLFRLLLVLAPSIPL